MSTLYLRKMGMDDNSLNDIKNHRVRVIEYIPTKLRQEPMFFEFSQCNKKRTRYENKRTGAPLKHPVIETVNPMAICLDTEYETDHGCYRDSKFEEKFWKMNLDFTKKSILKIINSCSLEKYSNVVFIEDKTIEIVNKIGGFREKEILKNDCVFRPTETWNNEHKIVRATERINHKLGNSFEVDLVTKKITN